MKPVLAMPTLPATDEAAELALQLVESGAEDAGHIVIAVTNGVEYLVTWNCRHIANAKMRSQIEQVCQSASYQPVIICTPDELMEPEDENNNQ